MTKNEQIRKGEQLDLAAALSAASVGLSDEQLRAVAGGRMADKTATKTAECTKCCWG